MRMAKHPVAQLWVQRQDGSRVAVGAGSPAQAKALVPASRSRSDLRAWVDRSALPASMMVAGGLALAAGGLLLASMGPGGFITAAAFGSMITLGGGLTFLGILKQRRKPEAPKALPAATTSPAVLAERARRIRDVLTGTYEMTFEALQGQLKWTNTALVETLVVMKEKGAIEEDLNLDTGEWVYRLQNVADMGIGTSAMLADRGQASGSS